MKEFKVTEIIEGEYLRLDPNWKIALPNGNMMHGEIVKIYGINLPKHEKYELNYVKQKIQMLLLNKMVEVKNFKINPPIENIYAKVSCKILLNGVDIVEYFPDFKIKR